MKSKEMLKQFRLKSNKDLLHELETKNKKLHELYFDNEFRKTKDIKSIKKTKHSIAQIWTILHEKLTEKDSRSK